MTTTIETKEVERRRGIRVRELQKSGRGGWRAKSIENICEKKERFLRHTLIAAFVERVLTRDILV